MRTLLDIADGWERTRRLVDALRLNRGEPWDRRAAHARQGARGEVHRARNRARGWVVASRLRRWRSQDVRRRRRRSTVGDDGHPAGRREDHLDTPRATRAVRELRAPREDPGGFMVLGIHRPAPNPAFWFIAAASLVDARQGTPLVRAIVGVLSQRPRRLSRTARARSSVHRASSGTYLQIRPKDSKPYKPLVSSAPR